MTIRILSFFLSLAFLAAFLIILSHAHPGRSREGSVLETFALGPSVRLSNLHFDFGP
jgi:hypothetical protein